MGVKPPGAYVAVISPEFGVVFGGSRFSLAPSLCGHRARHRPAGVEAQFVPGMQQPFSLSWLFSSTSCGSSFQRKAAVSRSLGFPIARVRTPPMARPIHS
jgi:hypothetical protein